MNCPFSNAKSSAAFANSFPMPCPPNSFGTWVLLPDGGQAEIDVRLVRSPRRDLLEKEPLIVVSMESERINVPLSFKS